MSALSRLLILSASYGEGHQQAAAAVRDALGLHAPATEVRVVDYLREVLPTLDSVAKYCYLTSVRFAPALYGLFYRGTSQIAATSLLQRQLNSLGIDDLARLLGDWQPDAVLATFPTPAGVVSHLKLQGRTSVPLATVITDHAIHNQWIHAATDVYFVGSAHVRRGLVARGVDPNRIQVTGIPVRPTFADPADRQVLAAKLGLSAQVPTLLIMGGAYGVLGDIAAICDDVFHSSLPLQVLVVTGHNERMRAHIQALAADANVPVKVYGFVREVHELMAVSDLMLGKAGGLTVSEALAMRLPMLLYRPIPGQEVQNTLFLVNAGVAVLARDKAAVHEQIARLLFADPTVLEAMRAKTAEVRRLHAADEIAQALEVLVASGQPPVLTHRAGMIGETRKASLTLTERG